MVRMPRAAGAAFARKRACDRAPPRRRSGACGARERRAACSPRPAASSARPQAGGRWHPRTRRTRPSCAWHRSLSRFRRTTGLRNATRSRGRRLGVLWWKQSTPRRTRRARSNGTNLGGLRALLACFDRELDALTLGQLAIALHVDVGLVHEHVARAIFRRDESKSLSSVEPLDRTYSHLADLLCGTHTQSEKSPTRSPCSGHLGRREIPYHPVGLGLACRTGRCGCIRRADPRRRP